MIKTRKIGGMVTAVAMALAGIAGFSQGASAQDGGLIQVAEVKVKTDRLQEFIALQHELAEAGREAGRTGRNVWQVMHGATNTFHIVEPRANFAEFDGGADFALSGDAFTDWVSRIVPTIDMRTVWTLREYPDLAIAPAEDYEESLIRLRIRTVKPGMNGAYEAWVRDDLLPELKKGGATGIAWYRGVTGMNGNTWFSITRHPNYADMDPPGPLEHMGAEAVAELLSKSASMQTGDNQDLVVAYRADMSY